MEGRPDVAVRSSITSCSLNAESAMRNGMEFILRPSMFRNMNRHVDVEGMAVERNATRKRQETSLKSVWS